MSSNKIPAKRKMGERREDAARCLGSPPKPLCQQGDTCHEQRDGLTGYDRENRERQQLHLPKPFSGFSGFSVVFTCFFHCCWAACAFLPLASPNSSPGHLSLFCQWLCRFSCRILTSPSAMPLPTAHSFLYYKHNAFPMDGEKKPCALNLFFSKN